MSILSKILSTKGTEVGELRQRSSREELQTLAQRHQPLGFKKALTTAPAPQIIAEVKKGSPSKGVIREDFNPVSIAEEYRANGASALSVLTDEQYFLGSLDNLRQIRAACPDIPLLRKDFIIDELQVWESRAAGADALLLIAAALSQLQLEALLNESLKAGLDVLLEVHNESEAAAAAPFLGRPNVLLGVNNRDLKTFHTDRGTTARIVQFLTQQNIPLPLVVSESGFETGRELKELAGANVTTFLIGESLLRTGSPGENLAKLFREYL